MSYNGGTLRGWARKWGVHVPDNLKKKLSPLFKACGRMIERSVAVVDPERKARILKGYEHLSKAKQTKRVWSYMTADVECTALLALTKAIVALGGVVNMLVYDGCLLSVYTILIRILIIKSSLP